MDHNLFVIKGGGAAHTREKVVACSARRFVIVADESKYVEKLTWPVPVEVLPFAARLVERRLTELGGKPVLRLGKMKDGPVITDNGNFVMDVDFGVIEDPKGSGGEDQPDSGSGGARDIRQPGRAVSGESGRGGDNREKVMWHFQLTHLHSQLRILRKIKIWSKRIRK